MEKRKLLLPALLSIAVVFSLILFASAVGSSTTMPPPDDHSINHPALDSLTAASTMALNMPQGQVTPIVSTGAEDENDKWNLGEEALHYQLTISSSEGGSVTTPGEGTFSYDEGTVVDLVAEPAEGYQFVNWTGDVNSIGDVNAATTNITMHSDYSITANFVSVKAGEVGVKAGDWIKVAYNITGWPAGQPYPEWLKLEFLSVEGTSTNVQVMMHLSDGIELSDTVLVDVVGGATALGVSGFVISANLTTGDFVYISNHGEVVIERETTRTYLGANRTVVYATFLQDEVQLTYYWDKLTGVLVEAFSAYPGSTITAIATETNMWEALPSTAGKPSWLWLIIAVVIVAVAFAVYRLKKKKTPTAPTLPPEGT